MELFPLEQQKAILRRHNSFSRVGHAGGEGFEREKGIEPPTRELLREVMEREAVQGDDEAIIGEEPPTTPE